MQFGVKLLNNYKLELFLQPTSIFLNLTINIKMNNFLEHLYQFQNTELQMISSEVSWNLICWHGGGVALGVPPNIRKRVIRE